MQRKNVGEFERYGESSRIAWRYDPNVGPGRGCSDRKLIGGAVYLALFPLTRG